MATRLYTPADAQSKLQNTICRYKGVPYMVLTPSDLIVTDHVKLVSLLDQSEQIVAYTSDDFDYSAFELGWYRGPGFVKYLSRVPGRYNNLGMARNNLDETLSNKQFFSREMYHCITGSHVSFNEACKLIWETNDVGVPFHRHAAIVKLDPYNAVIKYIQRTLATVSRSGEMILHMSPTPTQTEKLLYKIGVR